MAKVTLDDLTSLANETSVIATINENNDLVTTAIDNSLSRYGTSPNAMEADLDMNGNNLLNLPAPSTETEPVRVADMAEYIEQINGTSTLLPGAVAGDIDKIPRVASAGLLGYSNIGIDTSNNLRPETTDIGALGTSSLMWSDLFLASGSVINFNNGDVTVTHSSNKLDIDGGVVDFGSTPTVNGTNLLTSTTAPTVQIFTSSGTWTKPANCKWIKVTVLGGGGSGGGAANASASQIAYGNPGGAGGYAIDYINATGLTSETVTVGAGGAATAAGGNVGNSGGSSSFGTYAVVTGGGGGGIVATGTSATVSGGGNGGTVSAGDIQVPGQKGGATVRFSGTSAVMMQGGGNSPLGAGAAIPSINASGSDATGYGAGGCGCMSSNAGGAFSGSAGSPGIVIVEEFY